MTAEPTRERTPEQTRTAGLVLAAGEGLRFGGPKAPYVVDGERLVDRSVRLLRSAGCQPVVVVLGAWRGEVPDATAVVNPGWQEGMGSSLRCGLESIAGSDADRVLVTLVDLPGLTVEAVRRVAASTAGLAAATFDGERGHPVLLARSHWAGVVQVVAGDRGARDYLAAHVDETELVEVGDVAAGTDLDRP